MKIQVSKWTFDGNTSYKILHIEECCSKLTNSMNISINTCINTEQDEFSNYVIEKPEYSVKLIREADYEELIDYHYEKIDFCPFCGEPIEINIIEEIDKTEEYKLLRNERKILWNKCNNTDSKKKEYELRKQVYELDKKINDMWKSDGF